MSRAPRAPRPLPNNLYNLSAAEADVFGLEEGVVSVDVLQHRLDMLYAMYHNTRYAPRNQHDKKAFREIVISKKKHNVTFC